ncbi:hypothetical protein B7494_g662 [Chlorociboria aeruginascens]|nr:hypothetical protein B7494_g662 [Chlorociboria aeruginascens]
MGKAIQRNKNIMAQSTYQSVVLASRPKTEIVPGETFALKTNPMIGEKELKNDQVLVETLYLSLDPAMRDTRSYIPPVKVDEVMRGFAISKVVASKSQSFTPGQYVQGRSGWTELAILPSKELAPLTVAPNTKVTDALGVLGLTGLTAYFGLLDVGKVQAGDFVVVSGAAGATGSVVCQIAKLKGAKVLGIAGSNDKVAWLKELGCDDALNYKNESFAKEFREKTKDLIDVFFDNVGGEILELALSRAKPHARFIICGAISQYNDAAPTEFPQRNLHAHQVRPHPPSLLPSPISLLKPPRLEGFIIFDYESQYASARQDLAQWLSEGKIQRKETIIKGGLQAAELGLRDLFKGANTGKMLVEIKADENAASRL